jgi:hypothetical protein
VPPPRTLGRHRSDQVVVMHRNGWASSPKCAPRTTKSVRHPGLSPVRRPTTSVGRNSPRRVCGPMRGLTQSWRRRRRTACAAASSTIIASDIRPGCRNDILKTQAALDRGARRGSHRCGREPDGVHRPRRPSLCSRPSGHAWACPVEHWLAQFAPETFGPFAARRASIWREPAGPDGLMDPAGSVGSTGPDGTAVASANPTHVPPGSYWPPKVIGPDGPLV